MKLLNTVLLLFLILLAASCDSSSDSSSGGSDRIAISEEIEDMANDYDSFPEDAEVVDTTIEVGAEVVDGTDNQDIGTTDTETVEISVTIPESLSSRAAYSDVTVQIWINGEYVTFEHDGTNRVVSGMVTLKPGNNVLCAVLTKGSTVYRSALVHIFYFTLDEELISRWIRTGKDFDISGEDEGFEITEDCQLFNLELEDGKWVRTENLIEKISAAAGEMASYSSDYPTANTSVSSYTLSEDGTRITIVENSKTIYGVKM